MPDPSAAKKELPPVMSPATRNDPKAKMKNTVCIHHHLLVALAVVLLSACGAPRTDLPSVESAAAELEAKKQREFVLEAFVDQQMRLERVGTPILRSAVSFCEKKRRYTTGAWFWTKSAFPEGLQEAAASKFGASDAVQVGPVREGSPAAEAGLEMGDVLVAVNDWTVPTGSGAFIVFIEHLNELLMHPSPLVFAVLREQAPLRFSIKPEEICDYRLIVEQSDDKNAYADGERIVVFKGMMEFLRTDEELATVVAHETAHNVMGHIDAQKTNAVVGGLLGLALDVAAAAAGINTQGGFSKLGSQAGAGTFSVEFEQEADYVGLYLMARADYDETKAPNLWRRMAVQNPDSIQHRTTHPTTPERFVALEKTVAQIEQKRTARLPLDPEMKPVSTQSPKPAPQSHDMN